MISRHFSFRILVFGLDLEGFKQLAGEIIALAYRGIARGVKAASCLDYPVTIVEVMDRSYPFSGGIVM